MVPSFTFTIGSTTTTIPPTPLPIVEPPATTKSFRETIDLDKISLPIYAGDDLLDAFLNMISLSWLKTLLRLMATCHA